MTYHNAGNDDGNEEHKENAVGALSRSALALDGLFHLLHAFVGVICRRKHIRLNLIDHVALCIDQHGHVQKQLMQLLHSSRHVNQGIRAPECSFQS